MTLSENLDCTLQHSLPSLSHFSEFIDLNWIEESLRQTGKASIRRRKLPAEHVVWLVIGLALFRDQPIGYVVEQLKLVFGTTEYCVPSAAVQARQRLGREPLNAFFLYSAKPGLKNPNSNTQTFMALVYVLLTGWFGLCLIQMRILHTLAHLRVKLR